MALAQSGDHRAFEVVYDRYAAKAKAFFYRMLWADAPMAEDYVHDLFAKIIERPELYRTGQPVAPWLFGIAANMCKNAYRKRQYQEAYLSQLTPPVSAPPDEAQGLDEAVLARQLMRTLDTMDEDRRALFLLRYQQRMSVKSLAEHFGISEGTVKSRLFYLRKAVLNVLQDEKATRVNEQEKEA